MSLILDPATEQRLQQELAAGRYRDPSALIAHALELVRAERTGTQFVDQAMDDWLLRNRDAIHADLEETSAQAARGEGYSPEEARTLLAERRAARAA
jgi:predicted transcriptional regulator